MQKAKERYSKEKAAEYYAQNKEAIKKSQESVIKTCHKKKKTRLKSTKIRYTVYEYKISRTGSVSKRRVQKQIVFCSLLIIKNDWKNSKI